MGDDSGRWIVETINDAEGFRMALTAENGLEEVDSVQSLALFDNRTFGRVMILDGAVQVTTADEFIYHEMMAHVALFAHGAVRRVLIVGGGDGGIAREVLRHRDVEAVTLVEIDQAVIDLALAELPQISAGAFDDPRLTVVIADGSRYVAECAERFDVIVVDSPDPVGAGKALFGRSFYSACRNLLTERGILVTQSGMPFLRPDWFADHAGDLAAVFPHRRFFLTTVPTYTGGPMAHGFSPLDPASVALSEEVVAERHAASGLSLKCWTPALHGAAFALPGYVERLVAPPADRS